MPMHHIKNSELESFAKNENEIVNTQTSNSRRRASDAPNSKRAGRNSHPWRDDHLGLSLRDGLADLRRSEPSDAVWANIERELRPAFSVPAERGRSKNSLRSRLSRIIPQPMDGKVLPSEPALLNRLYYGQATLLSAFALVFFFAIGTSYGEDGFVSERAVCAEGWVGACYGDQLSRAEMSIQRVVDLASVDAHAGWSFIIRSPRRQLRDAELSARLSGREAYNRELWMPAPWSAGRSPANELGTHTSLTLQ